MILRLGFCQKNKNDSFERKIIFDFVPLRLKNKYYFRIYTMMTFLDFIVWTPSPEIFDFDIIKLRWYGLLFASAFLIGQKIIFNAFTKEGRTEKEVETLAVYMVVGTVLGARLGHCFFYDAAYYLSNPLTILKVWEGGLASHGAGIGMMLSAFIYYKKYKMKSYLWLIDRIALTVAVGGALIRFGNLMNSEIIGKPTNASHGFVFAYNSSNDIKHQFNGIVQDVAFKKIEGTKTVEGQEYQNMEMSIAFPPNIQQENISQYIQTNLKEFLNVKLRKDNQHVFIFETPDIAYSKNENEETVATFQVAGLPRHPAQLYESLGCVIISFLLFAIYRKYGANTPDGLLFGTFATLIFGLRFVYEFIKENQVALEDGMSLNIGQKLSIPLVLFGIYLLVSSLMKLKKENTQKITSEE